MDFLIQLFSDPVAFGSSHTLLTSQIGINSILASSMFVVLSSGQLSLAAPGFMAIGAYTSVLMDLYWHTPLAIDFAAGTALAGVVGGPIGLPVFPLRGGFLAIATIGFIDAMSLGGILNVPLTRVALRLKHSAPPPVRGPHD